MSHNLPWFPFYIGDYLKDTQHLNVVEHGMYLKLMLWYYSSGRPIPHEKRYAIADAMGLPADMFGNANTYAMVDALLKEYFVRHGAEWSHKRIEAEIAKRADFNKKQRDRAEKRWCKTATPTHATALPDDNPRQSHGNANHNHNILNDSTLSIKKPAKPKLAAPDWLDPTMWQSFVEHRTKLRRPMTEKAMQLIFNKLDNMRTKGHNPNLSLEQAIMNGWQGVFTPKTEEPNNGKENRGHYQKPSLTQQINEQLAGIK